MCTVAHIAGCVVNGMQQKVLVASRTALPKKSVVRHFLVKLFNLLVVSYIVLFLILFAYTLLQYKFVVQCKYIGYYFFNSLISVSKTINTF